METIRNPDQVESVDFRNKFHTSHKEIKSLFKSFGLLAEILPFYSNLCKFDLISGI